MPMPQYNGPMYSQGPTAVGPYNMQGYQPTFGYNPQQTYMPQTPQPSPSQEPMAIPHLIGRSISANDQIPPKEIPSDGSPAYFPMQDGSAILVKVWTGNGTIQTVRYVPEQVQQPSQPEEHSNEEILKRLESLESRSTIFWRTSCLDPMIFFNGCCSRILSCATIQTTRPFSTPWNVGTPNPGNSWRKTISTLWGWTGTPRSGKPRPSLDFPKKTNNQQNNIRRNSHVRFK